MSAFPIIDRYRAELRAKPFARLDDQALAEIRRRYESAHHSNAIEDIHPTPELKALFEMLLDERVPTDVSGPYVTRYIWERIVPADREAVLREAV